MTRSLKKNPFVANHLLKKIDKLNTKEEKEIHKRRKRNTQKKKKKYTKEEKEIHKRRKRNGRTTGIEPAHGGFTIHCLDPLGYIRPLHPFTLFLLISYISYSNF